MSRPTPLAGSLIAPLHEAGLTINIARLHRKGWVPLAVKDPAWRELGFVKAEELPHLLPGFAKHALKDFFHGVNGWREPRPSRTKPTGWYIAPSAANVEYLEWVKLDLDVNTDDTKPAIPLSTVIGTTLRMVEAGTIPAPTLILFSGVNLWLWWQLEDEPGQPPKATRENVDYYRHIEERLIDIFAAFTPDPESKSLTMHARLPGSINTKSGRKVFAATFGVLGKPGELARFASYRLDDFCTHLHLGSPAPGELAEPAPRLPAPREHRPAPLSGAPFQIPTLDPKKGHQAPDLARLHDLVKLANARGGFCKGHRAKMLHIAACCAFQIGRSAFQAAHHYNRLYARPPLPWYEVKAAANLNSRRSYRVKRRERSDNLARKLGVTPEEAQRLDLASICPTAERKRRAAVEAERKAGRDAHDLALRDAIREAFAGTANPALRPLADELSERGFTIHKSRLNDLKRELGITKGCKAGRPSSPQAPKLLPFTDASTPHTTTRTGNAPGTATTITAAEAARPTGKDQPCPTTA